MEKLWQIFLLLNALLVNICYSRPDNMLGSGCSKPLKPGQIIMGKAVYVSSTDAILYVRDKITNAVINNGTSYEIGGSVILDLDSTTDNSYNVLFEVSGANFEQSFFTDCQLKRSVGFFPIVNFPNTSTGEIIKIKAGFSHAFGMARITETFVLYPLAPTMAPTFTGKPSFSPSSIPSTRTPTQLPSTKVPTNIPTTSTPSMRPTANVNIILSQVHNLLIFQSFIKFIVKKNYERIFCTFY